MLEIEIMALQPNHEVFGSMEVEPSIKLTYIKHTARETTTKFTTLHDLSFNFKVESVIWTLSVASARIE